MLTNGTAKHISLSFLHLQALLRYTSNMTSQVPHLYLKEVLRFSEGHTTKVTKISVYLIKICFLQLFIYCLNPDFNKGNRLLLWRFSTGLFFELLRVSEPEKKNQDCTILNVMIWKQNFKKLMENRSEKHIW